MPASFDYVFSVPGLGSAFGSSGAYLIAAACIVAAVLGLFRGWRRTASTAGTPRCRLMRSLLAAFFLTPMYVGAAPAPAFLGLMLGLYGLAAGTAGSAALIGKAAGAILAAAAGLFALGMLLRRFSERGRGPRRPDREPTYCRVPNHAERPRRR